MKRILVFLLLGPASVVTAWLIYAPAGKGPALAAMALFTFAFFVASCTVLVDGYLADTLPIYLRAPLIAIVGAAIAVGMAFGLAWTVVLHFVMLPQWILLPFAIGGALCMGACSLLSNDYGSWQRLALPTVAEE